MSHSQSNYRYPSYSQQKPPNIHVTSSSVSNVVNNNTINNYNMNNTNTAHIAHIPPNAQYKWQWKCGSKWRDYQAKHSEVSNHRAYVTLCDNNNSLISFLSINRNLNQFTMQESKWRLTSYSIIPNTKLILLISSRSM